MQKRRIFVAILTLSLAILLFFTVDFTLVVEALKKGLEDSPLLMALIFVLVYVISTALGLPTSAILTISSGFLFGFIYGAALTMLSSGISMILSFLLGRYLFHSFVQNRFKTAIVKINEGMAKEGILYLFFLRLVPGIPFPILNMGFGITHMKIIPFWLVSQVAMIPIIMLLVNAGVGVEDVTSVEGVLTVRTIVSLVGIAFIPVVLKVVHGKWVENQKSRKVPLYNDVNNK